MLQDIVSYYESQFKCKWIPEKEQLVILEELIEFSLLNQTYPVLNFETAFIEAINQKLDLNAEVFQNILDVAFSEGLKLNYIIKKKIKAFLDSLDTTGYRTLLVDEGLDTIFMSQAFNPVKIDVTRHLFLNTIDSDDKYQDILNSIFARYCTNLFNEYSLRLFFSKQNKQLESYFEYIDNKYPGICSRNNALSFIDVSLSLFKDSYNAGLNKILQAISDSYKDLNNHCEMAVYIPSMYLNDVDIQWKLYHALTLFAEKHHSETIDRAYFRWKKVSEQTASYIPELQLDSHNFEIAHQGFVFKDSFIIKDSLPANDTYSLLLIFEKNMRDERVVNCPACWSPNVQGNSYPILNVKSWECKNPLCSEKSKYNRGNRYSLLSLLRQSYMMDDNNKIPQASISNWRLDVVSNHSKSEVFQMLLKHYSCVSDGITVYTANHISDLEFADSKRNVTLKPFHASPSISYDNFKESLYFQRYLHTDSSFQSEINPVTLGETTLYNNDCFHVLKSLHDNTISGAVTSPPYYNAKEYSQWSNIYTYLYDMYNISNEIFRVLMDGGVYLFNIFDYFDNENNIVFSAMGKKRMILGAYMLDIFERIGFSIQGNIIWDKGEIQGNRSFNQGNLSPYYQAPLNCWEHIFILSKGSPNPKYQDLFSRVESITPVIKMVKGKNLVGHTAPFPSEIPELLIRCMSPTDIVLDPFLGSGTTSLVANKYGVSSIGIEKNKEYFNLSKRNLSQIVFQA